MNHIQTIKDFKKVYKEMIMNLKNGKFSLENKLEQIQKRPSNPSDPKMQVEEKEANPVIAIVQNEANLVKK